MKKRPKVTASLIFILLLLTISPGQAKIIFVNVNNSTGGDGTQWNSAFNSIQQAINIADPNDQIWVAQGIYYENIQLRRGVKLYGGFDDTQSLFAERDYQAYETIIDGNQKGSVVIGADQAKIDGFTIVNGLANYGGGINCDYSCTTIAHCLIKDNKAHQRGGGIYCAFDTTHFLITDNEIRGNKAGPDSDTGQGGGIYCRNISSTIKRNHIANNYASESGGGIRCYSNSSTIIEENEIKGNTAGVDADTGWGGGIYDWLGSNSVVIRNNVISDNYSTRVGGGIYCSQSRIIIEKNVIKKNIAGIGNNTIGFGGGITGNSSSSLTIKNNSIIGNQSNDLGGGINLDNGSWAQITNNCLIQNRARYGGGISLAKSSANVINCTLYGNDAWATSNPGDGFYCFLESSVTIKNTILWNEGIEIVKNDNSTGQVSYSDVKNGYPGQEIIQDVPQFVDPDNTIFHLAAGSPCRDRGDPTIFDPDGTWSDLGAYGGPDADWKPMIYEQNYHMIVGNSYSLQISASCPDPNLTMSYSCDSPQFIIDPNDFIMDPNGFIHYTPLPEDQGKYLIRVVVRDNKGRESIRDVQIVIWSTTPIYVEAGANGDGTSWNNALGKIQEGIYKAYDNCYLQVWVKDGTYLENIILKDMISLYGGFSGIETALAERNCQRYETFIDGNQEDHVVIGANDARIDGFTITNGLADYGGGIYCESSSPVIANCLIKNNVARGGGGGIYCGAAAQPIITDNVIQNNRAGTGTDSGWGGGIYCKQSSALIKGNDIINNYAYHSGGGIKCYSSYDTIIEENEIRGNTTGVGAASGWGGGISDWEGNSSIIFKNNLIIGNHANNGGGIHCQDDSVTIRGNIIKENTCGYQNDIDNGFGGGIRCQNFSGHISHNIIMENLADSGGGGIYFTKQSCVNINNNLIIHNRAKSGAGLGACDSTVKVVNCTLFSNDAEFSEYAAYELGDGIACTKSNVSVKNSILWDKDNEIYIHPDATLEACYSDIRFGFPGDTNIKEEPRFVNPGHEIFHLAKQSPCRNSGDPNIPDPDRTRSDMGAYGGPEADWSPILYSLQKYWLDSAKSCCLHLPVSSPDPNMSLTYSLSYLDNNCPYFSIDNDSGSLCYTPQQVNQGTYLVKITVEDESFRETTKEISINMANVIPKVFVKSGSNGDGSTWSSALGKIQDGITKAYELGCPEVWVAQGTYKEHIILKDEVNVYGGFAGEDGSNEERNYKTYPTIIDGLVPGNREGSVVTGANDSRFDGFIVMNGLAEYGGGIYCEFTSPYITKCVIINNRANKSGGGIYCRWYANPSIVDNEIRDNSAGVDSDPNMGHGGGIGCHFAFPAIEGTQIISNQASHSGGGICLQDSYISNFTENTIKFNIAGINNKPGFGGGAFCQNSDLSMEDALITANSSNYEGTQVYGRKSAITIKNSAIIGEKGNRYSSIYGERSAYIQVINSVVWPTVINYDGTSSCERREDEFYLSLKCDNEVIDLSEPINVHPSSMSMRKFTSDGSQGNCLWSLPVNNSGGIIDESGVYMSGGTGGSIDVVKATGSEGHVGWGLIYVFTEEKNPGIAIIICASYLNFPWNYLNEEITYAANYACNTFISKGFHNIIYLHANPEEFIDPNMFSNIIGPLDPNTSISAYLNKKIPDLIDPSMCEQAEIQMVLYMVGHSENNIYKFRDDENIDPQEVNFILNIDPNCPGIERIVSIPILDFCYAGHYIPSLKDEKNRICITTCSHEDTTFLPSHLYFSNLFFQNIRKGMTIRDAFDIASVDNPLSTTPKLEADENANVHLGLEIPENRWDVIREINPTQYSADPNNISIWVKLYDNSEYINLFGIMAKAPYPSYTSIDYQFTNVDGNYELTLDRSIFKYGGRYIIRIFALDTKLFPYTVSTPKDVQVFFQGKDQFEPDDNLELVPESIYPPANAQDHTLHTNEDQDWFFFFGLLKHAYTIKVSGSRTVRLSLSNPIGVLKNEIGSDISICWECPQDGFYSLKVEGEGEFPNEGIFYNLSVNEEISAGMPTSIVLGRLLTEDGIGINGLGVKFFSSPNDYWLRITRNAVTEAGWYFITSINAGLYDIQIIDGLMPNKPDSAVILKQVSNFIISPTQIHRVDITLDTNPSSWNIKPPDLEFESSYRTWKDPTQYPIDEDNDGDGLTNGEEFLHDPDLPQYNYLYPGLNLLPFCSSKSDDSTNDLFCLRKLESGDSICRYNQDTMEWEKTLYMNGNLFGPIFKLVHGKGYLVYKNDEGDFPFIIQQKGSRRITTPLQQGYNLVGIFPIEKGHSSIKYIQELGSEKIKSIGYYNHNTGSWKTSYPFYGHSAGNNFSIDPNKAYQIMLKEDK